MPSPAEAPPTTISQDDLTSAWNWWNFEVLRNIHWSASARPELLTWLIHPSTGESLTLEDIRIRWAIVTPNLISSTSSHTSTILSTDSTVPVFKRFYIKISSLNNEFLSKLNQGKYRTVSPHGNRPLNQINPEEVMVLKMQQTSVPHIWKNYVVAIGDEEEFQFHYSSYHSWDYMVCQWFAVPYKDIKDLDLGL